MEKTRGAGEGKGEENVMLWKDENQSCFYIPLWAFSFLIILPNDNASLFLFRKEEVISRDTHEL